MEVTIKEEPSMDSKRVTENSIRLTTRSFMMGSGEEINTMGLDA